MTHPQLPFDSAPVPPRRGSVPGLRCPCGGSVTLLYTAHYRCSRCGMGLVERGR